jgi:hypothetical protein
MLEDGHKYINDLMFTRSEVLEQKLLEHSRLDDGSVEKTDVVNSPRTLKRIYRVKTPELADWVRWKMTGLGKLRSLLEEQGVDFRRNLGLWIPAVTDEEAGDVQVNITASANFVTRTVSAEEIALEMESGYDSQPCPPLDPLLKYRMVRRSGRTYRVAIRNPSEHDAEGNLVGSRTSGLNDFCIVLGAIPLNLPSDRVRARNKSAWRGVAPPLF